MTGADSPVIAASLTEAMPSITSPSEGMMSPASTSTIWPGASLPAGVGTVRPRLLIDDELGLGLLAGLAQVAACALPRPSATASAKLANRTVNHSHTMIWKVKPKMLAAGHPVADKDDVVSA